MKYDTIAAVITFGLKQALGDNVHYFFAGPIEMPSLLVGLETQKYDRLGVEAFGLGKLTVEDGLAGPFKLFDSKAGMNDLINYDLTDKMSHATHIAWGTGDSMVPYKYKKAFIVDGKNKI